VGARFTLEADAVDGVTRADSENAFGMAIGTGIDLRLGERTGLSLDGRYSGFAFGYGDCGWSSAVGATAHAWLRFYGLRGDRGRGRCGKWHRTWPRVSHWRARPPGGVSRVGGGGGGRCGVDGGFWSASGPSG
jgi:hypothetical protein